MKSRTIFTAFFLFLLSACQDVSQKGLIGNFKIGERAQIGPLIYNIYETQYLVTAGDGPDTKIPKNRFLVIHLSVVNGGGANADRSVPAFTLLDDAGESYNELENGAGVARWLGFARRVRPAESMTGAIVFDVPPKHYTLRITDEADEHYALVDLPLSFGTPTPTVERAAPAPISR